MGAIIGCCIMEAIMAGWITLFACHVGARAYWTVPVAMVLKHKAYLLNYPDIYIVNV